MSLGHAPQNLSSRASYHSKIVAHNGETAASSQLEKRPDQDLNLMGETGNQCLMHRSDRDAVFSGRTTDGNSFTCNPAIRRGGRSHDRFRPRRDSRRVGAVAYAVHSHDIQPVIRAARIHPARRHSWLGALDRCDERAISSRSGAAVQPGYAEDAQEALAGAENRATNNSMAVRRSIGACHPAVCNANRRHPGSAAPR